MKLIKSAVLLSIASVGLSGCFPSSSGSSSAQEPVESLEPIRFAAAASPSQERDAAADPSGIDADNPPYCHAFFELEDSDTLVYDIICHSMDGVIQAHIHQGLADENGPVTGNLYDEDEATDLNNDPLVSSRLKRDDETITIDFDDLISDLRNDRAYFNVHTDENRAGEVRGHLVPTSQTRDDVFPAILPDQEVFVALSSPSQENGFSPLVGERNPACDTRFILNADKNELDYSIFCRDINDVVAAHIHQGNAREENGAVIAFLFDGNKVSIDDGVLVEGTLTVGDDRLRDVSFSDVLQKMRTDKAYVNVHTETNSNGEVRGQVVATEPAGNVSETFAAAASPSQEVNSDGEPLDLQGIDAAQPPFCGSIFRFNGFDKIAYEAHCQNILEVTMAHIHQGSAQVTGPVTGNLFDVHPYSVDVSNGKLVAGTLSVNEGNIENDDDFNTLLGDLRTDIAYFNVHTESNGAGEVRGQIGRLFGSGSALLPSTTTGQRLLAVATPSQERGEANDPTVDPANPPSCITTMNLTTNELAYRINCANIENVIQAHIHEGLATETGGVIALLFDVDDDNAVNVQNGELTSGVLTRSDLGDVDFNKIAAAITTDKAYVNVHTTTNRAGEVRGQAVELTLEIRSDL